MHLFFVWPAIGRLRLTFLVLLALVAGCQPLPQPFAHNGAVDKELLAVPDHSGVIILPVSNAPEPTASALAEAVAAGLRDTNVPASTSGGNKRSLFLQGRVEDDGVTAQIAWELFDPKGELIDDGAQSINGAPMAAWQRADPDLMAKFGGGIGRDVAGLIQAAAPAAQSGRKIAVTTVAGAPGDGDASLAAAMRQQLTSAGVAVVPPVDGLPEVRGEVSVVPAGSDQEEVRINWVFVDAGGREGGVVAQANAVPTGSLDGSWGGVAQLVAEAAVPAILELLDAAPAAGEPVYRR